MTDAKVLTPVILEQGTIIQFILFYLFFIHLGLSKQKRVMSSSG